MHEVMTARQFTTDRNKRILLIAPHGSYRTVPFINAAHELSTEVLIASESRHSIVSHYARGLHVPLHNPEHALQAIVQEARHKPFAAIIGTDDSSSELAAFAARALGIPHNDPHSVRLARRKDLARQRLAAHSKVPVPGHVRIDLSRPLAGQISNIQFPCVAKPIALSASQGVIRADNPLELIQACQRIEKIIHHVREPQERRYLLVEDFVPGIEVAVEGLLSNGDLTILAIFDKPDPLNGPFFEETYYTTPSVLDAQTQANIQVTIGATCKAYGLREGPIHAECRINNEGVWIMEVAARTIGGLCGRLLRFGTGYSLEQLVIKHALGQSINLDPEGDAAGVLMIPIPKAGILRRVEGLLAAEKIAYIEEVNIQIREGYELAPLPEGSSYLGFIFARAPSAKLAEQALRQAHGCLNIVIAPLWKAQLISEQDARNQASS
jgi:biotin carboxylase